MLLGDHAPEHGPRSRWLILLMTKSRGGCVIEGVWRRSISLPTHSHHRHGPRGIRRSGWPHVAVGRIMVAGRSRIQSLRLRIGGALVGPWGNDVGRMRKSSHCCCCRASLPRLIGAIRCGIAVEHGTSLRLWDGWRGGTPVDHVRRWQIGHCARGLVRERRRLRSHGTRATTGSGGGRGGFAKDVRVRSITLEGGRVCIWTWPIIAAMISSQIGHN